MTESPTSPGGARRERKGKGNSGRLVVLFLVLLGVLSAGGSVVVLLGTGDGPRPGAPAFQPGEGDGGAAPADSGSGSGGEAGTRPYDGPDAASGTLRSATALRLGLPDAPIGGISFVAPGRPISGAALDPVGRVASGWIAVVPYAFLLPDDGGLRFDPDRQMWGEGSQGIRETVRLARERGLRVLMKPHVWTRGGWIGDYVADSDEGWESFEEGYRRYLLTFAHLADSLELEMLAVGTEKDSSARLRPEFWRELIAEVREIYGGPLTYAANWDRWEEIPFWDDLDYIGVDAYFPLSDADTPEVEELLRAWRPVRESLRRGSERWGKPVLFAEYGYRSIAGTAGRQWELPPERTRGEATEPEPNMQAQVNAYEALFQAVWDEPWFAGGFLWKWFPDDARWEGRPNDDYTPQHKPVEAVIRSWYGGPS